MAATDRFGLPLTTASSSAADDYGAAVDLILSANAGAEPLLDRALAADPDFALAHIAAARMFQMQFRIAEAKAAAAQARALLGRVSKRERGHIETVALAVDGDGPGAMARLEAHIADYPRDALPLSLALGVFGLLGFSGRLDHHEAQLALLEGLAPQWDGDWWFLTYLGWARIELGDLARGIAEVERALALQPRNAYGAHARAHGYFEAGEAEDGAEFVAAWLPQYDRRSQLHCHLSWHQALFELARGTPERARALYDDAIRPGVSQAPPFFTLFDAAALLWRWQIYGETPPLAGEWDDLHAFARRHFPQAGLHFADLHAALAEAASGDDVAAQRRIEECRERERAGKLPQGAVVAELCAGAAAFARGDYQQVADTLGAALAELPRVGGSHAQRELFEDTFIVACLRAGQTERAASRLRRRLDRRPSSRDRRWLAEAGGALTLPADLQVKPRDGWQSGSARNDVETVEDEIAATQGDHRSSDP
jgi:tetratricopeptide (TPR) repeat protein